MLLYEGIYLRSLWFGVVVPQYVKPFLIIKSCSVVISKFKSYAIFYMLLLKLFDCPASAEYVMFLLHHP